MSWQTCSHGWKLQLSVAQGLVGGSHLPVFTQSSSEWLVPRGNALRSLKPNPNKASKIKVLQNTIEFVLCWPTTPGHGPALRCSNLHTETPLEKTNFSFASGCQLQIASWLGVEIGFNLSQAVCTLPDFVSSCVCRSCCGWKAFFLDVFQPLCLLKSLCLLFPLRSPSPEGIGLMKTSHSGRELQRLSLSALCPYVGKDVEVRENTHLMLVGMTSHWLPQEVIWWCPRETQSFAHSGIPLKSPNWKWQNI